MPNPLLFKLAVAYRDAMNSLFYRSAGGDKRPVYFDIDETFPALRELERNFDVIREELEGILPDQERMRLYHEVDRGQTQISGATAEAWRVFFLRLIDDPAKLPSEESCPRTFELLGRVPNMLEAFFSILEPGKCIPSHNGRFFGYLRYHLAFKVPKQNPPTIRIKDTFYTWKEREGVLFDDSWNHEVFNEATETRIVLIVDLMRPMPWPLSWMNRTWVRIPRALGFAPGEEKFQYTPAQAAPQK